MSATRINIFPQPQYYALLFYVLLAAKDTAADGDVPQLVEVASGASVELQCQTLQARSQESPAFTLKWWTNHYEELAKYLYHTDYDQLREDRRLILSTSKSPSMTFTVQHVDNMTLNFLLRLQNVTRTMEGTYSCGFDKTPIVAAHSYSLDVLGPPRSIRTALNINDLNITEETENLTAICQADAKPPASYKWLDPAGKFLVHGPEYALVVKGSERSLSGAYTCRATNAYGILEQLINIVLPYKPRVFLSPQMYVRIGQPTSVKCSCDAHPAVDDVTWLHNGLQVMTSPGNRFEKAESTSTNVRYFHLVLTHVQRDSLGNYTCVGRNRLGLTTNTTVLIDVPRDVSIDVNSVYSTEADLILTVYSIQSIDFKLTWNADNNSDTQQEAAGVWQDAYRWLSPDLPRCMTSKYLLSSLKPNTMYNMELQAIDPDSRDVLGSAYAAILTKDENITRPRMDENPTLPRNIKAFADLDNEEVITVSPVGDGNTSPSSTSTSTTHVALYGVIVGLLYHTLRDIHSELV